MAIATSYSPINIAFIKYWGKRDVDNNLPLTESLGFTIPDYGTEIFIEKSQKDYLFINGESNNEREFFRLFNFIDKIYPNRKIKITILSKSNVPISAGVASSSSFFAAVTHAIDKLHPFSNKSKVACIGSGSASRSSLFSCDNYDLREKKSRFVKMHLDGSSRILEESLDQIKIGLLSISNDKKLISSRDGMILSAKSELYDKWPIIVQKHMQEMCLLIQQKDIEGICKLAEMNSLYMHSIINSVGIFYTLPKTLEYIQNIHNLRTLGVKIFFTQDAGPNLKLIFHVDDLKKILHYLPEVQILN